MNDLLQNHLAEFRGFLSERRALQWLLDANHQPVPASDFIEWARWFENMDNRRVALTVIDGPDFYVSTVFLGLDHNHFGSGDPVLFETMIFGAPDHLHINDWPLRCCTWEQAETLHWAVVHRLDPNVIEGSVIESSTLLSGTDLEPRGLTHQSPEESET